MGGLAKEIEYLTLSDVIWKQNLWWRIHDRGSLITNPYRDWSERRKSVHGDTRRYPSYKYRPLPSTRSIRILRPIYVDETFKFIFASLATRHLDDCEPYFALSYTWGPAETPPEQRNGHDKFSLPVQYMLYVVDQSDLDDIVFDNIRTPDLPNSGLCDHVLYEITLSQNLSDFLVSYIDKAAEFRSSNGTSDIWIDAICINQGDSAEKSIQVQGMGDVYRNAQGVIVWLGNEDEGVETFKWMNDNVLGGLERKKPEGDPWETYSTQLCSHSPTDTGFWRDFLGLEPKGRDWLQIWDQFLRFIQRKRWFRRCWILQEYALAQVVYYLCRNTTVPDHIQQLRYLADWIIQLEEMQNYTYGLSATLELFRFANDDIRPYVSERGCFLGYLDDPSTDMTPLRMAMDYLMALMDWTRERECAFDVDRVFSVLGVVCRLLGPSETIYPDVEGMFNRGSPAEVFTWVAANDAEHSLNLYLLSKMEPRSDRKLENLPSWVPDFSVGISILPVIKTGCDAALAKSRPMKRPQVHGYTLTLNARCIDVAIESYPACLGMAVLSLPEDALIEWISAAFEGKETPIEGMTREDALESITMGLGIMSAIFRSEDRLTKQAGSKIHNIFEEIEEDKMAMHKFRRFLCKWVVLLYNNYITDATNTEMVRLVSLLSYRATSLTLDLDKSVLARRLFLTNKPYAGLGPESVEPGDTIWLFEGGQTVYLLRENEGRENFAFMGDCYVLGIMDGQLMTPDFSAGFVPVDLV